MRRIFIISMFMSLASLAQPGKEAWHWRFGRSGGLDFSSGIPVQESGLPPGWQFPCGCASISDQITGQYLLSTHGTKIFNKNNTVMLNGYNIAGSVYAGQHLIVPDPGNKNQYYVFTNDWATANNMGVHYSVVDMTLQGGLGEVTIKNLVLTPGPTVEKITAIRHCNGKDYWILTHLANSNSFQTYLLSASGINTTPVVSSVGTIHQYISFYNPQYREGFGQLKASPNGKNIALGIESDSIPIMEIFDFDNSTGIISNPLTITYPGKMGPGTLSFSSDNSKLYCAASSPAFDTSYIYQYDLSSGNPALILNSETQIFKLPIPAGYNNSLLGMQLAPEGRIYIARHLSDTLAIISNPNMSGSGCNFSMSGPVLPGVVNLQVLPNFIDANYAGIQINIPDVQQCNTFTATTLDAGFGFTNYFWSTGASTQTISISAPGKYWVTVTNTQGCTRTDTLNAYLIEPIRFDTVVCDTFHVNVIQNGVLSYNWFDANQSPIRDFTQSGNYYVDVSFNGGCSVRDSLNITIVRSPQINLGRDTSFCKGNLFLDASCNTCSYHWSTGETTSQIAAKSIGTYWVQVTDANGCKGSDTLVIKSQPSAFDFVMPNIVTPNEDNINDDIDFGKYQFSTFSIEIYNRWGQKVFSSKDAEAIWKPTGDEGTYFYAAQYKIECGTDSRMKELKGFITIIR